MQKNSYLFVKFGNQFRKAIYVWEKQSKTDQVFKKKKLIFSPITRSPLKLGDDGVAHRIDVDAAGSVKLGKTR